MNPSALDAAPPPRRVTSDQPFLRYWINPDPDTRPQCYYLPWILDEEHRSQFTEWFDEAPLPLLPRSATLGFGLKDETALGFVLRISQGGKGGSRTLIEIWAPPEDDFAFELEPRSRAFQLCDLAVWDQTKLLLRAQHVADSVLRITAQIGDAPITPPYLDLDLERMKWTAVNQWAIAIDEPA